MQAFGLSKRGSFDHPSPKSRKRHALPGGGLRCSELLPQYNTYDCPPLEEEPGPLCRMHWLSLPEASSSRNTANNPPYEFEKSNYNISLFFFLPAGPEAAPSFPSNMMDAARDAGLKQAAPARTEKPAADFAYVGIDAILEQMRRKAMKQGFEFNIMVVGQSGLGKSTLINTLFKSKISRKSVQPSSEERIPKTIEIKSITHEIEEKGVRMKLTVIDTPGFGDHINNENCWQPIMKFINDQYEKYLQEELNINRKKRIPDSRVHCCIYFIPATGHSLRPLDIEFMRRLSKVVNIVPVIAKADTLTLEERDYFKQRITADLLANGIDVYPQKQFDEDSEDRLINEKFR
ncbi:Septin-9, partial [Varanus komodoensis]